MPPYVCKHDEELVQYFIENHTIVELRASLRPGRSMSTKERASLVEAIRRLKKGAI